MTPTLAAALPPDHGDDRARSRPSRPRATRALPEETRAEIVRLHGEGLARNAIARQLDVSGSSVSKVCREAGLTFPPAGGASFVQSAALTLKQRTTESYGRQLNVVEAIQAQLLDGLNGDGWETRLRGTGGSERIESLRFVPADDMRDAATALNAAVTAMSRLKPLGDDEGATAARSVVEKLIDALGLPPEVPEDEAPEASK